MPKRPLGMIVAQGNSDIIDKNREFFPIPKNVADGFSHLVFRQQVLAVLLHEPGLDPSQDLCRLLGAKQLHFLKTLSRLSLDRKQLIDHEEDLAAVREVVFPDIVKIAASMR